jgi:hypothetical protein
MDKKPDHGIESGQFWAVKVRGTGGDLVLGRIISVHNNKDGVRILSENLLTGKESAKSAKVLLNRNKKISKRQAIKFLKLYQDGATKAELREAIVKFFEEKAKKKQLPLPQPPKMNFAARCYEADQKARKAAGWCGIAWVGINYQDPKTPLEKKALAYIKKRYPNGITVHVYDLVEMAMDLMEEK